ncbi:PREDICTED: RHOMBOID-like protein 12, mitochondrial isoform X2 [Prunus mume]|uniref:RHOMBOID-like protein 12, mitochondrial isoform X2 n=1 Tax=Prunus mume TaxID=102107 RepID=A0ABM0PII4_PRUMU|nr:PREDICTED: RHOMBOID-like protein 12, mitochondrial isoform X2 [Prunus mume]
MQRLLRLKLASNLPKKLSNPTTTTTTSSIFHFQPHKTLSLTKPPQTQNYFFSSFTAHPLHHHLHSWRSQHTLTQKINGFLFNPLLKRQFCMGFSNTLLRVSSKSLSDFRLSFLRAQFPKQSFRFNPNFTSPRSPWRSWFRRVSDGDVVLGLIIANVAVFILWRIADPSFMAKNFTIGRVFGPEFLLKLYLAGAVGGSVCFLVHKAYMAASSKGRQPWNMDPSKIPGLGASGAVNAIMLLDIFLFPKSTLYLEFIIPVPAILLGIFLIGKDVLRIIEGDSHISGAAHLGGAAVAAIAWARLRKGRF